MKLPQVIMLVGLPGTGKSTWIQEFLKSADRPYTVLSADAITTQWAKEVGIDYTEAFKRYPEDVVKREIYRRLDQALRANMSIIWDQTNLSKENRSTKLGRLPGFYRRTAVVFTVDPEEQTRRLNAPERIAANKVIPEEVMTRMRSEFEMPDLAEFDEVIHVS